MREPTLEEIRDALDLHRHGTALAYEYLVSHQWFTLRITSTNLAGTFHLLLGSCERIEFDTSWNLRNLTIEKSGEYYIVRDEPHLYVKCGIITAKYNVPPIW